MRLSLIDVMFLLQERGIECLNLIIRGTIPRLIKALETDASNDLTTGDKFIATAVEAMEFTVFDGMSRHNEELLS